MIDNPNLNSDHSARQAPSALQTGPSTVPTATQPAAAQPMPPNGDVTTTGAAFLALVNRIRSSIAGAPPAGSSGYDDRFDV